jgi:hypothetical protein
MSGDLFDLLASPPSREALISTTTSISRVDDAQPTGERAKRGRVRLTFRVFDGEGNSRLVTVVGRDAWMLGKLVQAGAKGCATLEQPAPRTSHYIWKLRHTYGIAISSVEEEHGGPFAGHHVRYILQQRVEFADESEAV